MNANNDQMVAKSGPYFSNWRAGMIACVGGHFASSKPAKELARS